MSEEFIPPSSPSDRKKISDAINEGAKSLQRQDDEKSAFKDIADRMKDEFDMKPKLFRKLATTVFKHNFQESQGQNQEFEDAYEVLVEGRND